MKVEISRRRIRQAGIFLSLVFVFAVVFYFLNPSPVNEWNYHGVKFVFRDDLKLAKNVPTSPDCQSIFAHFNTPYVTNVTLYFKNDTQDFDLFNPEIFELSYKITAYSMVNTDKKIVFDKISVSSEQWNLADYPKGSPSHPRIYLIGPTSAKNNSVEMENFSVTVQGRNLKELDLATIKTMMCIFGINI